VREAQLLVRQRQGACVILSLDAGSLKEEDGLYTRFDGSEGAGMGGEL